MNSKLILILLIVNSTFLAAQTTRNDSLRFKYNNQTIFRTGSSFMKGTERLGLQELKKEFSMSELGMAGYEQAKKYKTTSRVVGYLSMASGLVAVSILANNGNRNLAFGFNIGQLLLLGGSMQYRGKSNQSLDKALWQRNKDLLFPQQ